MANNITNIILAEPHVIAALLNDKGEVDFNKIIPQPEDIYLGNLTDELKALHPNNWLSFNTKNWGTKWNAYQTVRIAPDILKFEAAWSHPFPVMEALQEMFPDEFIGVLFSDENRGYNLGGYAMASDTIYSYFDEKTFGAGTAKSEILALAIEFGQVVSYDTYDALYSSDESRADETWELLYNSKPMRSVYLRLITGPELVLSRPTL
jgi:hypothetical protein